MRAAPGTRSTYRGKMKKVSEARASANSPFGMQTDSNSATQGVEVARRGLLSLSRLPRPSLLNTLPSESSKQGLDTNAIRVNT